MLRTRARRTLVALPLAAALVATVSTPLGGAASPSISSMAVNDYTVSPSYATDGTIFAWAEDTSGNCPVGNLNDCGAVFRSTDRGATWTALPSAPSGLIWSVVLPSAYPGDATLYAPGDGSLPGSTTLWRSDDTGGGWRQTGLGISGLTAAARPGQAAGHAQIVIQGNRGFSTYDEASETTTAGPTVPLGDQPYNPAFVDADTFFTTALTPAEEATTFVSGLAPAHSQLLRCTLTACTDEGTLSNWEDSVFVSPDYASDHAIALWGNDLEVSTDGGASFTTITGLPFFAVDGVTFTADAATGPRLVVTGVVSGNTTATTQVVFSGSSYTLSTVDTTPYGMVRSLAYTPDGHIWGARILGNGTLCSADLGSTWAATC